jgi:hypothetical protein
LDEEGCDFGGFGCWVVRAEGKGFVIGKRGVFGVWLGAFIFQRMRLEFGSIEDVLCASAWLVHIYELLLLLASFKDKSIRGPSDRSLVAMHWRQAHS